MLSSPRKLPLLRCIRRTLQSAAYPIALSVLVVLNCGQDTHTEGAARQPNAHKPLVRAVVNTSPRPPAVDTTAAERAAGSHALTPSTSGPDSLAAQKARFLDVQAGLPERRAACRAIIEAGGDAYQFLLERFPDQDNHLVIRGVLNEMAQQQDLAAIPLTLALFQEVPGEDRIDFEALLLRFGQASVEPLLGLMDAEDWPLVNRAMDALAKLKATQAVEPMIAKLNHEQSWIQIKAAHCLGDMGDRRAIPPLISLLKSQDYNVVGAALIGLGKLKAREAFDDCLQLTGHEHPRVRAIAASTLGKLGDKRATDRLRSLLNDEDKGVVALARKALEELQHEK